MQHRTVCNPRNLIAVILIPLALGCANTAEEVFVTEQPAPNEVLLHPGGASTVLDMEIDRLANATEVAFAELGIALEEREVEDDGVDLSGNDGGQSVTVEIDRDDDEVMTEVDVSVTRDGITFDSARSGEILRRIMALARS
ncbi:MAG TPA: hypothetical protein VHG09_01830 [Longimicrobiales bacterium]|nr:hypothetical protein [Longimicrobiales bacterium]